MKKIIAILAILTVAACAKDPIIEYVQYLDKEFFDKETAVVKDATPIEFNLPFEGEYNLSIEDEFTNQVLTTESFKGIEGANKLNIYTKVIPSGSYNVVLKDKNGNQIKKSNIAL